MAKRRSVRKDGIYRNDAEEELADFHSAFQILDLGGLESKRILDVGGHPGRPTRSLGRQANYHEAVCMLWGQNR